MADVTITAASVLAGEGATKESGTAGATITAGQAVYKDSADSKYKLSDNNSATPAVRAVRGLALNGASNGQPLTILKEGPITIGATLTPGVAYYLSDTPGGICLVADLASGEYPTSIGIAASASVLNVKINSSGVAL